MIRSKCLPMLAALMLATGCESGAGNELGRIAGEVFGPVQQGGASTSVLTSAEIDAGLRQALEIGADRVADRIGKVDGYWQDPRIRIPLPGRLGEVQRQLSGTPLAGPLDDLQLRMNRAAEAAVPQARAVVVDAVRGITIEDAVSILRGGDTAATDYLRQRTEASLRGVFRPHIASALEQSGAYRILDEVTSGNALLAVAATDYKSELTNHAVALGLDGVFTYLAEEESEIRRNPVARTTDLLRKVFGS